MLSQQLQKEREGAEILRTKKQNNRMKNQTKRKEVQWCGSLVLQLEVVMDCGFHWRRRQNGQKRTEREEGWER